MILQADASPISLNTLVSAFAGLLALFILRAVHKLYDWNVKNNDLPQAVRKIQATVDKLASALEGVIDRFDAHCKEEESWQVQTRENANRAAGQTQASLSESEERLQRQIESLSKKLDGFIDRRKSPRHSNPPHIP